MSNQFFKIASQQGSANISVNQSTSSKHFISINEGLEYMNQWKEYMKDLNLLVKLTRSPSSIFLNFISIMCLQKKLKRVQLIEFEKFPANMPDTFITDLCTVLNNGTTKLRVCLGIKQITDDRIKDCLNYPNECKKIDDFKGLSRDNTPANYPIDKIGCVVLIADN